MNIVLLSGGSGKRLWPLSNDVRSKQFIKIFRNQDNKVESMVERVYRQIKTVDNNANITIATSKKQVSTIKNQLGGNVSICVEPCRRDTFPAIALAASYLKYVKNISENEVIIICPVDPYVDTEYFATLVELENLVLTKNANITLMGIEPTYPSEKYGYIIPRSKKNVSLVSTFKEKPTVSMATSYINKGALWNSGVFAFKLKYILQKAHELIDFVDYEDLFSKYEQLNKISFDYAVVEKEENIIVKKFSGSWKDLGTWNTLVEAMNGNSIGKAIFDDSCSNTHVVNELDIPILSMGLKNIIVAASPEGILVADKNQSSYIKQYIDKLDQQIMFADKSWGTFHVLDVQKESLTIKVTLNAGNRMNYHSHASRDEVWTVISGQGKTLVDGMEQEISVGDVITMQAGCKHTVFAETELQIIEVQLGEEITVNDKEKYQLEK